MIARPRARGIVGPIGLLGLIMLSTFTGGVEREAGACSCGGPVVALIGPDRVDDAPLNTKVRLEMPNLGAVASMVLRVHGSGKVVVTTARSFTPGGWLSFVELTPSAPLEPSTQYEVATVEPTKVPSTTVIGTFHTGTTADTTPPHLDSVGAPLAFKNINPMGSACQVAGPWINIDGVRAADPGRPDAQLVYGVWLGDAGGNIDAKRPPTALLSAIEVEHLQIGQSSVCDPRGFPIPKAAVMWLGIAAIDEAGNTSAVRRVRVDLAGARHN